MKHDWSKLGDEHENEKVRYEFFLRMHRAGQDKDQKECAYPFHLHASHPIRGGSHWEEY